MKARIPGQQPRQSQAQMLAQIQQMQADMEAKQAEIENSEFTASVGGGEVEVTVSGAHEVRRISIKPDVVDPDDVEMLEDLLQAAVNEAMRKADEAMNKAMEAYSGAGMGIPGLGGLMG